MYVHVYINVYKKIKYYYYFLADIYLCWSFFHFGGLVGGLVGYFGLLAFEDVTCYFVLIVIVFIFYFILKLVSTFKNASAPSKRRQ